MIDFSCMYIAASQFERNYDPAKQELVNGLIRPPPQRQSTGFHQCVYPVQEETFNPKKSQLVVGLTS